MEFNQSKEYEEEYNHDPESIRELATYVFDHTLKRYEHKLVSQTLAELADQIERLQKRE